jgi:hypothetical protein
LFTGLELFESLSSKKLSTRLKHPWQSREKELDTEVDEVEIQDEDGNRKGKTDKLLILGVFRQTKKRLCPKARHWIMLRKVRRNP